MLLIRSGVRMSFCGRGSIEPRQLTEDQRLSKAFDLTNSALVRMHEEAMAELDAADPAIG